MAYVDKTALVYKLANGVKSNFLSRPRRFGKSLLVSTLHAYFEGRKDLFKGLAIETLENEWKPYPVVHIDLSNGKYFSIDNLYTVIDDILNGYEAMYGIECTERRGLGTRLKNIIQAASSKTSSQVVVLIDEYDAPMLDSIGNDVMQEQIRNIMRDFFSPLKSQERNLRFVFLTGITKFSQMSIFSELNNIVNISMDDEYSTICGITEQEMLTTFQEGIADIATANGWEHDEAVSLLRRQYDGYCFSAQGVKVYNPYSLLNSLRSRKLDNYWFSTGTPTFLLELLTQREILTPELEKVELMASQFDVPTEKITDPLPVLYQSGYITIKAYDQGIYTLGFPNEEVRTGFNESMFNYIAPEYGAAKTSFMSRFRNAIRHDDVDDAMEQLQSFLAGFPYNIHHNREDYYQAIIYTIFTTLNYTIQAEVETARGRIDLLLSTKTSIFVFELKVDKSADEVLAQIDSKDYALQYKHDGRRVFKVGVSFSSAKKTITEWKVERL